MIRVTIDLITKETGSKGRTLYFLEVVNDGTGTPVVGNYDVQLFNTDGYLVDEFKFKKWPRQMNAWEMLKRIVKIFARRDGNQ